MEYPPKKNLSWSVHMNQLWASLISFYVLII